jgi:hypothetical protein
MKPTPEDVERDQHPSKPIVVRNTDEGNIPGRPSPVALAFIVVALLVALGVVYFAS